MKIYFACPTGERREGIIEKHGKKFGACLTRDTFNNKTAQKMEWFFDNGAYSDFGKNIPFNSAKFHKRLLEVEMKVRSGKLLHPDFVVIPDIVRGGDESLLRSAEWLPYLNDNFPHHKYYLAVQDNMSVKKVEYMISKKMIDGLFVGGSKPFKYNESAEYVALAKKYGIPIHCGGIGTPKDILWAKMAGYDSVDSGIAMIHSKYLAPVLNIDKEIFWQVPVDEEEIKDKAHDLKIGKYLDKMLLDCNEEESYDMELLAS